MFVYYELPIEIDGTEEFLKQKITEKLEHEFGKGLNVTFTIKKPENMLVGKVYIDRETTINERIRSAWKYK